MPSNEFQPAAKSFVLENLHRLDLPTDKYIVVGSGVLDALGIRKARDIDFVCNEQEFKALTSPKWSDVPNSPSKTSEEFEAFVYWDSTDLKPNFIDLMKSCVQISGHNFIDLQRLKNWKTRIGRPKDIKDVELINKYLQHH